MISLKKEFLFLLFLLFPFPAFSQVRINEVAWMGTENAAWDEWIELKNLTEKKVTLTGWTLKAQDKTPMITLEGEISPEGFFLLERTDDSTCPKRTADQIYKGSLQNEGEALFLADKKGETIDKVEAKEGWPAGDNLTKQTMERKEDGWQTSLAPGGTPKKENSKIKTPVRPQAEILPSESYRKPARRRFLKTFLIAFSSSLVFASLTLTIKRILRKEKLLV